MLQIRELVARHKCLPAQIRHFRPGDGKWKCQLMEQAAFDGESIGQIWKSVRAFDGKGNKYHHTEINL